MTQPDLSVADAAVTMLDGATWSVTKPDVISTNEAAGKGIDVANNDYVLVSRTTPTSITYSDLFLANQDINAAVFVEIKTSDSDTRRDDIFGEVRSIFESNRVRPDTPNDFDRVRFADITPLEDETFGVYLIEFTAVFEARSWAVTS